MVSNTVSRPEKPKKVLILGSGPIVIGQAAEFDYAGTQACKAMREEGVQSVLVNSNPATIMTDTDIADAVYIEPLTVPVVERIIARERPDGLLPTLGGQTGLNLAKDLADAGVLEKYGVRLLGTPLDAIKRAEDRELFRELMLELDEPVPPSAIVTTLDEAHALAREIGFPLIVRPAYTLGGTGGGVSHSWEDLDERVMAGLNASPVRQILLERSLVGWKEVEYEVMRDGADNCITVCNMENFDPMGVHTGDSIVVAPSQTLADKEYQMLRTASIKIIRALGIEGGCNIQFGLDPKSFDYIVIEVNPRVSRSSALASKATGYPIARVAAKIAVGRTLDSIENAVTGETTAAFEPALDYCVVKIPRWPFDKFPGGDRSIGTQMKATGEVMAIERSFEAALQKAVRSLEMGGRSLLWEDESWQGEAALEHIFPLIDRPNDQRLWALMAAIRRGVSLEELHRRTAIDMWFLDRLAHIKAMEQRLLAENLTPGLLWDSKRLGFSDSQIATLAEGVQGLPDRVREMRHAVGIRPVYKMVDTCAAEFAARTPYFYSTYEVENEALPATEPRAVVLGSGPIRIGQGIEFDYCSVHSAWALNEAGWTSIMINSNPETVSTDFDTSDRLYFEALDEESVFEILCNESGAGGMPPVIAQFGGQTAINLAGPLERMGAQVIGSSVQTIDMAEDRRKFENFLDRLGIPQPPGSGVTSAKDALTIARHIGYPVLVRPSYVLGGRAMEIIGGEDDLQRYLSTVVQPTEKLPVLIDKYLQGKEVEVDAISDGQETLIPGIMEHIERAGVHSGDSFAVYPAINLTDAIVEQLVDYTARIAIGLGVRGLVNIQYVIHQDQVYVIEVNPRSSRTVPFLSKVTGVPMVRLATHVQLGKTLRELGYPSGLWPRQKLVAVKAPVFSMSKLVGVDTYLGPEMKSTGEVMGVDRSFAPALYKAMLGAGINPGAHARAEGELLLSIADRDKDDAVPLIKQFATAGYSLVATPGTAELIRSLGLPVREVGKLSHGDQAILELIRGGTLRLVINTVTGGRPVLQDGFEIRRAAAENRIPCLTSLDTARALAQSLTSGGQEYEVLPITEYAQPRRPK
ncbi:MAG: Carbamoyl-phosphate synthase large chain [uncultured Chloroflexi bacterium]|uniref:Carbamoyl phosphate synthase large chain n=1 Tax=uncultured Chloroflexota bacterium TaxID=166587 RepID=A0A6J4JHX4_9CHLR|nr:MAG: Carbamoyl-phosphate synthase large chain [uncultured Chloroflexota bacterium]